MENDLLDNKYNQPQQNTTYHLAARKFFASLIASMWNVDQVLAEMKLSSDYCDFL